MNRPIIPILRKPAIAAATQTKPLIIPRIIPRLTKPRPVSIVEQTVTPVTAIAYGPTTASTSSSQVALDTAEELAKRDAEEEQPHLDPITAAAIATTMKTYPPISLLKNKTFDLNNENAVLIDQFKLLVTQIEHQMRSSSSAEERKKHGFRLSSIKKAIEIFEEYPGKIKSGSEAKQIKGIGVKIADRINEILRTGSLAELTEKKFATDYTEKVRQLCTVTGIGPESAPKLIEKFNLEGVDDLIEKWKAGKIKVGKHELTHHMEVGLRWYHDIKQKIPRDEMDQYSVLLKEKAALLDSRLSVQVCGSYRRGKAFSGDIDVLMTHPDFMTAMDVEICPIKYLLLLVDALIGSGIIVDSLTDKGETKYMGVAKLNKTSIGRRIDIRFVPYECWAPAIFYFTGSMLFNKIFRGIALQRGYTVNEYGIYHLNDEGKKGDKVPSFSEEQIFAIVGVDYLTPEQREM